MFKLFRFLIILYAGYKNRHFPFGGRKLPKIFQKKQERKINDSFVEIYAIQIIINYSKKKIRIERITRKFQDASSTTQKAKKNKTHKLIWLARDRIVRRCLALRYVDTRLSNPYDYFPYTQRKTKAVKTMRSGIILLLMFFSLKHKAPYVNEMTSLTPFKIRGMITIMAAS